VSEDRVGEGEDPLKIFFGETDFNPYKALYGSFDMTNMSGYALYSVQL
jgi:hypothetical protein